MTSFRPPAAPKRLVAPPRGRVLVIAPHPDDETLGVGGTLLHHSRQGDLVEAVFICSGIQGDPDGYFARDDLTRIRQEEARAAAEVLGIRTLTFWGYPDNLSDADYTAAFPDLPEEPDEQRRVLVSGLAQKLLDICSERRPDIVYFPWRGEVNPDHWAAGEAVAILQATQPELTARTSFLGYDVWAACPPDLVIDTSDVITEKLRAVNCYRSQILYRDYEPAVRGLDAYRSLFLEAGATFGEAFVGRYLDRPES